MKSSIFISKIILFLTLASLFLSIPIFNFAQESVVKGVVTDSEGNALKDAKITLLDPSRGTKFTTKTDKHGKFVKVGIPPSMYRITVELEGYFTFNSQLPVRLGMRETINIKLEKIPPKIEEDKDLAQGIEFFKQGKYDQAIESFKKVIEKFPSNPDVYYNLGLSYLRSRDINQAITAFEKVIEINPEAIEVYFALGECYFTKEDNEKALAAFSQALELQPDNPKAYYNLGILYYKYDKLEEALSAFEKSIELNPEFSSVYYQAGLVSTKKGNFEKAIEFFNHFLKLEPNAPEADQVTAIIEELKKQIE